MTDGGDPTNSTLSNTVDKALHERSDTLAVEDAASGVTLADLLASSHAVQSASKAAMVDLRGFEPLTPSMRTRCATGLRHRPLNV
jgi:hypothetical protein